MRTPRPDIISLGPDVECEWLDTPENWCLAWYDGPLVEIRRRDGRFGLFIAAGEDREGRRDQSLTFEVAIEDLKALGERKRTLRDLVLGAPKVYVTEAYWVPPGGGEVPPSRTATAPGASLAEEHLPPDTSYWPYGLWEMTSEGYSPSETLAALLGLSSIPDHPKYSAP